MKNIKTEEVIKAIIALLDTTSDKQLYSQIIATANNLGNANFGKLFVFTNDRLKKVYSSDESVKRNTLIKNKHVRKLLAKNEILYITHTELKKLSISNLPSEIKFITIVPLLQNQVPLGFLYLYYLKENQELSPSTYEVLTLYSHAVALALTKAKMQDESQKALEIRDRFISLASHELRTPLTSINGYIQLLHSRMKDNKTLESRWINELYIESIRMTRLVKELLDVNRIKQGQFAFVFSEVPMHEVIKRAIERYQLTNPTNPYEFQTKLTTQQTKVVGDFDKLVEMVSGLLGNAVKFSKPGSKITVILKNSDGMVSLEVKDKGKGIPKQDLVTIFNGFYKPDLASHIEGMGVGLLLARHIVDNHRGKLKITSKENKGTSVTVSLPVIKTMRE